MRFIIFQDSLVGDRTGNEDRVGYAYAKDTLLMVIADGMGGHEKGEVAAEIAVQEITRRFKQEARARLRRPFEFLVTSIQAAHRAIVAHADQHNLLECPRTTCVACVVQNGYAYWAHAGDSRLYVLRGGRLLAQTQDHSKVQQMIDAGQITPEQAARHPDRNKIFSCLGGVVPPHIDMSREIRLETGDTILLSTDGFWAQIPPGHAGADAHQAGGDLAHAGAAHGSAPPRRGRVGQHHRRGHDLGEPGGRSRRGYADARRRRVRHLDQHHAAARRARGVRRRDRETTSSAPSPKSRVPSRKSPVEPKILRPQPHAAPSRQDPPQLHAPRRGLGADRGRAHEGAVQRQRGGEGAALPQGQGLRLGDGRVRHAARARPTPAGHARRRAASSRAARRRSSA
jgi:serine/threonine protein phosphatase PrpC